MFPNAPDKYAEPTSHLDTKYNFITEYYDPQACIIRRFLFSFYPTDKTIEMVDIKMRRKFLARTKFEHIAVSDLFIGNKIHVYSRQLTLTEFADVYTERQLGSKSEKTFGMIKPDVISKMGDILTRINGDNFTIVRGRMVTLNQEQAGIFYREHRDKGFYMELVQYISSGPVFALELVGNDAVAKWRKLIGPTNVEVARREAPNSLRAKFGTDLTKNSFHGADSAEAVVRELSFFFPEKSAANPVRKLENTAKLDNTTCCLLKPHVVKKGLAGEIIRKIQHGGFEVTGANVQEIDKANAEEFFEVYKGVVAEYQGMCAELCEGPSIALELSSKDSDTVEKFRQFCGPADPEIARHIRPGSLRAIYGRDKVKNAVHCTDLPENGPIEIEYFMRILNYLP